MADTCPVFSRVSQVSTAAAMAVHAPHLPLPPADVDWILGDLAPGAGAARVLPGRPLVSTSTGRPFRAATLRELLRSVVADVATNLLDVDAAVQGVCLQLDMARPVVISAMGPSPNIPALARRLATGGFRSKTLAVISGDRPRRLLPQARGRGGVC